MPKQQKPNNKGGSEVKGTKVLQEAGKIINSVVYKN
jgi:hypothetical protein